MKTRDKNYIGCDPGIQAAISSGKEVYCECWGSNPSGTEKVWVVDYNHAAIHKYITSHKPFIHAIPIETKLVVKKASEIIKWLEDNDYCIVGDAWCKARSLGFSFGMLRECGKEPDAFFSWLPDWLEEDQ